ncbi:type I restriction enzyme, S subunit [Epilithonimonas bovis DSM 19482]|uniref:Type I restriction enzyme, S subunit n=1 Tax=Epilithonimonas bovis DSM 19482 TaxID=1121284 RepID=A0A1U7PVN3_9FLAO|nr:restriction endonuclease subunit S [Epilithonimonas bovis]SIT96949.1 type I restriction enzyme, S subunit [Epilithonimonas bovis DSM 19482]
MSWKVEELGEVCQIINGRNQKYVISENGSYPIFGSGGNVMGYATKFLCEENTVIIGRKGNISNPILIKQKFWNVDTAFGIYPFIEKMLPLFNYYQCLNIDFASYNKGTTIPSLVKSDLLKIQISYPKSLSEQQAIVEKLDAAFALIDHAKANIEKNIQNAKELFQSKLNQIFSQKGEGWEEKKINDVSMFKSGTTLSPQIEKKQGEIAYLKVADMNLAENLKGIVNTSSRYVNKVNINTKNIIPRGSIIFPKRGGAILTDKKRFTNIDIVVDLNIMAAIPIKTLIDKRLLFYFFLSFKLSDIANGTTILQINNYSFDEVRINIPKSLETQQEIVSQLDALSEQTKQLEAKYKTKLGNLEELRKSILEKAFKGELVQMSESQISTD